MMYKKMLLATVIGLGLMTLSLNAAEMKCGAGKCGSMSGKEAKLPGCESDECVSIDCQVKKDAATPHSCKECSCGEKKASGNDSVQATMKCGGSMKCGAGKCGKGN